MCQIRWIIIEVTDDLIEKQNWCQNLVWLNCYQKFFRTKTMKTLKYYD